MTQSDQGDMHRLIDDPEIKRALDPKAEPPDPLSKSEQGDSPDPLQFAALDEGPLAPFLHEQSASRDPEAIIDALVSAFNRWGHHDHNCPEHDSYNGGRDCPCGFNAALSAALRREAPALRGSRRS